MDQPLRGGNDVRATSAFLRRLMHGVVTAWCLALVEFTLVMTLRHAEVASVWELQHGLWGLTPAWLLIGLLPGAFGGTAAFFAERSGSRGGRIGFALLGAAFGLALGYGVGGGRHLAALGVRVAFSLSVAAAVGAASWFLGPWLARGIAFLRTRPRAQLAASLVWIAGLLVIEALNQLLLVRLYPAFHLGLSVLVVVGACLWVSTWLPEGAAPGTSARSRRAWATLAAAVLAGVLLLPASRSVAGFDNFRLLLLENAPSLAWGVKLAARVAPPPTATCQSAECGEAPTASGEASLDWSGRDIVLISVDALRADHLGAYGYGRKLTPELDGLAREGAVFERAYAATPHTSYSVTSLMTGKYMRPLLLQGAGDDSDTWAGLLRTYGYKTAAFYPPAVFFIDTARFEHFQKSHLDFEYGKVEFAEGDHRIEQVRAFMNGERGGADKRLFLWMHLFGPHEPYEAHPGFDFGPRDIDRYDSEIASADRTIGAVVRMIREQNPNAVIIVTADHGEEFGDHGGRYHGTSVYEEQVRVPLIVVARDSVEPRRIGVPVQTIDLLPTVLGALSVPRPARMRGRDLGPLLAGKPPGDEGLALAETDEQALLAEGDFRLICERKVGACRLYDLKSDPGQTRDVSSSESRQFERMRTRLRALAASHGEFEARGLRAEGKGWPAPILRGISGDADAAPELAELLDDADVTIRRKAAELLFELRRREAAPALRLALTRDEDIDVRRWAALGLTRLGEGAPLVFELVDGKDRAYRRLAALALAEIGDRRGEKELIAWWRDPAARDFERSREILQALARLRAKDAMSALVQSLDDVRLRPDIARTLAAIGDDDARGPLAMALRKERYQGARGALVDAIVRLGGDDELVAPLVKFLGVPDPLKDGVGFAQRADILDRVGGPKNTQLAALRRLANSGVDVDLVVPPGGNGKGVRLIVRARVEGGGEGKIYVQKGNPRRRSNSKDVELSVRNLPTISSSKALVMDVAGQGVEAREIAATLPSDWNAGPGRALTLSVFGGAKVRIEALAVVPLADELPPPPPEPWKPASSRAE